MKEFGGGLPDPKKVDQPKYGGAGREVARGIGKGIDATFMAIVPDVIKPLFSDKEAKKARNYEKQVREHAGERSNRGAEHKAHFRLQRMVHEPEHYKARRAFVKEQSQQTRGLQSVRAELARYQTQKQEALKPPQTTKAA